MILIFGCGILGRHLLRALADRNEPILAVTSQEILAAVTSEHVRRLACDVRSERDLARLASVCAGEPLTVFYFAAQHNIDAVFADPDAAREVNIVGLRRFLSCGLNVRRLFFASTDCVYGENDERHPRFAEDDPLLPVNEYGKQKAEAEATPTPTEEIPAVPAPSEPAGTPEPPVESTVPEETATPSPSPSPTPSPTPVIIG